MAWWNPGSWFKSASYQNVEGNHVYTLMSPSAGEFLSAFRGGYSAQNYLQAFMHVPEVFAVYDAIASRVMNGRFYVRRRSDGADITRLKPHLAQLLGNPNPFMKGDDFRYAMVVYKLVCGNRYTYKKTSSVLNEAIYTSVRTLWQLRPQVTEIRLKKSRPEYFDCTSPTDLIEFYRTIEDGRYINIDPKYVKHDTDVSINIQDATDGEQLKGLSSMQANEYPISNLCAVYEARNVIFVKRGPLGAIISRRKDASGSVALTPKEKTQLRQDLNDIYGLQGNKSPLAIVSGEDLDFVQFGANIRDLMPFEETRACMYAIAAVEGVPQSVLPREKGATYANASAEERGLYTNRVIPEANEICDVYNEILGLNDEPFEIAVDFSHVEVLQENRKDAAQAGKTETETAKMQYEVGAITKNAMRIMLNAPTVPGEDYYVQDDPLKQQRNENKSTTGNRSTAE